MYVDPMTTAVAELAASFLEAGTVARFEVSGTSMRPFIRAGDVVTASPTGKGQLELKKGDVAFARIETNRYTLHRVVGFEKKSSSVLWVRLAGDGLVGHDHVVPREAILGKASMLERNGRSLQLGKRLPLIWHMLRPLRHGWTRLQH